MVALVLFGASNIPQLYLLLELPATKHRKSVTRVSLENGSADPNLLEVSEVALEIQMLHQSKRIGFSMPEIGLGLNYPSNLSSAIENECSPSHLIKSCRS